MLIRISPQWQITIPKALRQHFGPARQAEARIESMALVLRPVLATTIAEGEEIFAPQGITTEVLVAAMGLVERRRREAERDARTSGP
jgi:bifunctional DNA-binding transcriptional regulator/antitoxin component of YhaV-PrlF toxin-antitoxin module